MGSDCTTVACTAILYTSSLRGFYNFWLTESCEIVFREFETGNRLCETGEPFGGLHGG